MSLELDRLDIDGIDLELSNSTLQVKGKRGGLTLDYDLFSAGKKIGRGCKRMVLSGLREFDKTRMDEVTDTYNQRKKKFS
jgi:hypothetical protein